MIELKGPSREKFENSSHTFNLNKIRETKLKDKKLKSALKETMTCMLFVALTMSVSYQMLDSNSLKYQQNLLNLFEAGNMNNQFYSVYYII